VSGWIRNHISPDKFRPSIDELIALVRRYIIQETIVPLKAIAIGVAIALGGALVFAIGGVIALLGVLRLLQNETGRVFSHTWQFVPYLATAAVGLGMIGLAALAALHSFNPSRTPKAQGEMQ
jgi:hypothetical protein